MKNFKCLIAVLILSRITGSIIAQPSSDLWAIRAGGDLMDHGKSICTDSKGNVYVTGGFQSKVDFGDSPKKANGGTDIFLSKYNETGKLLWSRQGGSNVFQHNTLTEYGSDILSDGNFIYVTGVFLSLAKFGDQSIQSKGSHDIFLAKYALDGELLWVRRAGGQSQDIPYSMSIDKSGNIYLTGSFQKTAEFADQSVSAKNALEMFLAKYNSQGDVLWVKQFSGNGNSQGKVVRCQGDFCFVAGEFENSIDLSNRELISQGKNVLLAKFNLDGEALSTAHLQGDSEINVADVVSDGNQTFLTGSFTGRIERSESYVRSVGNFDVYLAKFDEKENLVALNSFGGKSIDNAAKIIRTSASEIMIAGNFQDDISVNESNFKGNGASDMFMFHFSNAAEFKRGEIFGGTGQDQLNGAVAFNDYIYSTGFFRESISLKDVTFSSKGFSDIIIMKNRVPAQNLYGTESDVISVKLYPNPSKDYFFIKAPAPISFVKIRTLVGKVIFEKHDINLNEYKILLDGFVSGLYIVETQTLGATQETKIIVDR